MGSLIKEKRRSKDKKTGQIKTKIVWGWSLYDGHGQRKKKMVGSKARARQALEKAEHDKYERVHLGKLSEQPPPDTLFDDLAHEYLTYSQAENAGTSYRRAEGVTCLHLRPYFGGKFLGAITKSDGERYKQ